MSPVSKTKTVFRLTALFMSLFNFLNSSLFVTLRHISVVPWNIDSLIVTLSVLYEVDRHSIWSILISLRVITCCISNYGSPLLFPIFLLYSNYDNQVIGKIGYGLEYWYWKNNLGINRFRFIKIKFVIMIIIFFGVS